MTGEGTRAWADLEVLGRTTLELLRDGDWVARRVETVRFVDTVTLERRVTLDIDVARLRAIADSIGTTGGRVLVPLAVLAKRLLLDIDVRDGAGTAVPIVPRAVDAEASQALMLAQFAENGGDPAAQSAAIRKTLYDAAYGFPSDADIARLTGPISGETAIDAWQLASDLSDTGASEQQWEQLLTEDADLQSWLTNFTLSFMLMVELNIESDESVKIIKYRYVEALREPAEPVVSERLGIADFIYFIRVPGIGTARSEHFRMEAPQGLFFTFAELWQDAADLAAGARIVPAGPRFTYRRRLTRSRVAIYTGGLKPGKYHLQLGLRPTVRGFLRTARLSLLGSLALLTIGAVAQLKWSRLTPPGTDPQTDAATAILLLVPSIFAGYLAREGEHELLSELLRWPRLAVAAAGFGGLVAGGALVLDIQGRALGWIWALCAAVCAIVMVQLSLIISQSNESVLAVDESAERTVEDDLVRLTSR